ncbi:MAG: hypothetical protein ABEI97_03745, partial [Candidatus Nanohaloarchaea archaeon]
MRRSIGSVSRSEISPPPMATIRPIQEYNRARVKNGFGRPAPFRYRFHPPPAVEIPLPFKFLEQEVRGMADETVTLPSSDCESMLRTIRILGDEAALETVKRSEEDIAAGRVQTLDEVRAELD